MAKTAPDTLDWKIGVEVELLAPKGCSRYDLALAVAHSHGGTVHRCFHPQSEPSKVPDAPIFENLTLGFEVYDARGDLLARCVDDLTLQLDLDKKQPPKHNWYRIVSDDMRLLRLIMHNTQANAVLSEVLKPVAKLFNSTLTSNPDGMVRLSDDRGASIAIAAPLPGERERPCELITAPLTSNHYQHLQALLSTAQALQFYAPAEGATHIHFDATRLCSAAALANLVALLWQHGTALRQLVGSNPRCTRLGGWPQELHELVYSSGFTQLRWEQAVERMAVLNLTKYCDFNLVNLLRAHPEKHTFEVRIFPVWLEAAAIMNAAALFVAILNWALDSGAAQGIKPVPADMHSLLQALPLKRQLRAHWLTRLNATCELR